MIYEKLVKLTGRLVDFSKYLPKEELKKIDIIVRECNLSVSSKEIINSSIFLVMSLVIVGILLFIFTFSLLPFITFFLLAFISYFYVRNYPSMLYERIKLRKGGSLLLATFFIVIYLRLNPNLERALEFAANNLKGLLGKELKSLVWKIRSGIYSSALEALDEYAEKWKNDFPEFLDAVRLIEGSLYETSEVRRSEMLDRAIERMLEGSLERANRFAIRMKQPVNAIYMLGIILPILLTVLTPMFSVFAGELFDVNLLFVLYNILLPFIVFLLAQKILAKRPIFFSRRIESHPLWPKEGKIRIFNKEVSLHLILLLTFLLSYLPIALITTFFFKGELSTFPLYLSFVSIFLFSSLSSFFFWKYYKERSKEIKEIEEAERSFSDICFQIGNRLTEGLSPEASILKVSASGGGKNKFLQSIAEKIERMGLDLETACFHPIYGALRYFRSDILSSGMKILIEGIKKSFREAAIAMINFSRHLNNMKRVELKIEDLLGDTVSSMKFNIMFIMPLLLGIVIGLTALICVVLWNIREQVTTIFEGVTGAEPAFGGAFLFGFLKIYEVFPLAFFQLIIGTYLLQVVFICAYIINEILHGGSFYQFCKEISTMLLISGLVYSLVGLFSAFGFVGIGKFALQLVG